MKKGDIYYLAIFDGEDTPMISVWKYKITTINKNGIYLGCQEKYLENTKEHLRPETFPKDRGFRKSPEKAKKALLPKMREDIKWFESERAKELYSEEDRMKILRRIRSAIAKIEKLKETKT